MPHFWCKCLISGTCMTLPGCTDCGWVDRRVEASSQRSPVGATCPIKAAWSWNKFPRPSAEVLRLRRTEGSRLMSLFSVPTGQTAAPEAAGMKGDVPTPTEAAAARPSIYSRLIGARDLQDFAGLGARVRRCSSSGVKHANSSRNRCRGIQALMTRYLMPAPWTGLSH